MHTTISVIHLKAVLFIIPLLFAVKLTIAQKLDSIYFNLYTDSLKKGTYNYINVEGRYSNGRYLPLSEKELQFSSSAGTFSGNSLFVDSSIAQEKILLKVVARHDPSLSKEITIWIKRHESNEALPTRDQIINSGASDRNSRDKRTRTRRTRR